MIDVTFTAIDFETARYDRTSICQVGLVRVESGIIVNEVNLLTQPPSNYYRHDFTTIHGIDSETTAMSPSFAEVWPQLLPYIADQRLVAHNGFSFDFDVLRKTLTYFALPIPDFEGICTYQLYRKSLDSLCAEHAIPLDHHDALSDARACATLYMRSLSSH